MPLHPVFEAALEAARRERRPALSGGSVLSARELVHAGAKQLGDGPDVALVKSLQIPGRAGPIRCLYYRPVEAPPGLVVYFHGGGWVAGSAASFDALARALAARSGCAVLNVEYRLAPDHVFPAGLEDAEDAIRWASQRRGELASVGAALVVAGDSAGGNLATVAASALAIEIDIALQVLFYPVVGADFDTPSYLQWAEGQSLTRADMRWFFSHYALEQDWGDPRISPLNAQLIGAPAAWIAIAEYDVLRSEGSSYADRLRAAGVQVESNIWMGLAHGFARWFNRVDVASHALDAAADAIRGAVLTHSDFILEK
jgi:acetyl esterase